MSQPLGRDEFDRWATDDRLLKQRLLDHMDRQVDINLHSERRFTALETKQDDCAKEAAKRSTWISGIVSAVISGLLTGVWGSSR